MTRRKSVNEKLRLLSMGWGVQSWTLAVMSVMGDIEPFHYVVNSDTGYESSATYEFKRVNTAWLEARGANVVGLERRQDEVWTVSDLAKIPAFTVSRSASGDRRGMKQRSCTRDWKVRPQNVWTRAVMRERGIPLIDNAVQKALGISLDEYDRAKHSELKYIEHIYPLLDLRMSRKDCIRYLRDKGLPVPPKSACVFCPYTNSRLLHSSVDRPGDDKERAERADAMIRDAIEGMKLYVSDRAIPLKDISLELRAEPYQQTDFVGLCDSGHCFL